MKRLIRTAVLCGACLYMIIINASAALPYKGYAYNAWGKSVPSPDGYEPSGSYNGNDTGKLLNKPSDLYVSETGNIYISDTGNNRIVEYDKNFKLIRSINQMVDAHGKAQPLTAPAGLFVDGQNQMYVALPTEKRVVLLDADNRLKQEFTCPHTDLIDKNFSFQPVSVVVNKLGTVFILVKGLYLGAVTYDKAGKFLGFYGANKVNVTVKLLADYFWKKILSQSQINKMERYIPVQYANFDVDAGNFIYTCSNGNSSTFNEICKLNSLGNNILQQTELNVPSQTGDYGDLERTMYLGQYVDTAFVDVCVNDDGLIFGLDKTKGRIFEYDQESKLLNIFGASGYQRGSFQNPVAIDTLEEKVLVLDKDKGAVTVFSPTEYGALIEKAVLLHNNGEYEQAKDLWEKVLNLNVNCELAYSGIGKALYEEGKYKEALSYFDYGYDRVGYSRDFKEYRVQIAKEYFPYVLTLIAVCAVGLPIFLKVKNRKKGKKGGRG